MRRSLYAVELHSVGDFQFKVWIAVGEAVIGKIGGTTFEVDGTLNIRWSLWSYSQYVCDCCTALVFFSGFIANLRINHEVRIN